MDFNQNAQELIESAREQVYYTYKLILQAQPALPISEDLEAKLRSLQGMAFWRGRIDEYDSQRRNYFLGKLQKTFTTAPSNSSEEYRVALALPQAADFEGIKTFENYTGKGKRSLMVGEKKVIVITNSIEEMKRDKTLMAQLRAAHDIYSKILSMIEK